MNNKYCGQITDFKPVFEDRSRVVVSYEFKKHTLDGNEYATWYEVVFYKKQGAPTLDSVKRAIIDDINARTDEKILKGFVWNGINVWLSEENQRNFSEAQRLNLVPVKFKLSELSDGTPVYHTFESAEDLNNFYTQAATYIQQCLQDGWNEKDNLDFTPFESYFGVTSTAPAAEPKKSTTKKK